MTPETFTEYLSAKFNLCATDAHALEHTANVLANLAHDKVFLRGLIAWSHRSAERLVEAEAAEGKEPSGFALGQRSEMRNIALRLAEIVDIVIIKCKANFARPETQRHDPAAVSP